MLFNKTVAFCSENHMKPIKKQNAEWLNVKAGGMYKFPPGYKGLGSETVHTYSSRSE
jgi:hypothetical protein